MTDATATQNAATTRPMPGAPVLLGIGVLLGGLVILFGNADVKKGDNGGLGPAIGTAVILVVLTAVLTLVVLPRVRNANRTAIILSAIAIVTLLVFWAGITPVLAAAAVAAGGRADEPGNAAKVLQVIAVVAAAVTVVVSIAQTNLF